MGRPFRPSGSCRAQAGGGATATSTAVAPSAAAAARGSICTRKPRRPPLTIDAVERQDAALDVDRQRLAQYRTARCRLPDSRCAARRPRARTASPSSRQSAGPGSWSTPRGRRASARRAAASRSSSITSVLTHERARARRARGRHRGAAALLVAVLVLGERDAVAAQGVHRRRGSGRHLRCRARPASAGATWPRPGRPWPAPGSDVRDTAGRRTRCWSGCRRRR